MNKKTILIGIISLTSICGCSNKNKDNEITDKQVKLSNRIGEHEGYEYAKGVKYFDTYLGDEIPTSIDYPGFENTFAYHPEEKYFTLNGIENSDEYKITTQLYFADINNDGYKEILVTNNRFYKADPEDSERRLNTNLDPFGCWIFDLHKDYTSPSGLTGASVNHYCSFGIDEKGELVENWYFHKTSENKKSYIVRNKYFYSIGDYLYNGIIMGSEEVETVYFDE